MATAWASIAAADRRSDLGLAAQIKLQDWHNTALYVMWTGCGEYLGVC